MFEIFFAGYKVLYIGQFKILINKLVRYVIFSVFLAYFSSFVWQDPFEGTPSKSVTLNEQTSVNNLNVCMYVSFSR